MDADEPHVKTGVLISYRAMGSCNKRRPQELVLFGGFPRLPLFCAFVIAEAYAHP